MYKYSSILGKHYIGIEVLIHVHHQNFTIIVHIRRNWGKVFNYHGGNKSLDKKQIQIHLSR